MQANIWSEEQREEVRREVVIKSMETGRKKREMNSDKLHCGLKKHTRRKMKKKKSKLRMYENTSTTGTRAFVRVFENGRKRISR